MIGCHSADFAVYADLALPTRVLEERKQGLRSTYEIAFRHPSGNEIPVLVSGAPRFNAETYQGTIAVVADLTERRQAEKALIESEMRYRLLVDTLPIAIGILQGNQLVFANQAAARLLRMADPMLLLGKRPSDIIAPEGWEKSFARIQRLMAGEEGLYPVEDVYVRSDGTRVPVEVHAIPFNFDGRPALQVLVQDITERTRRRRESEAQTQIAQLLTTPMALEPLLTRIVEAGIHAIDAAQTGSILMAEPDGSLQVRSVAGFTDERIKGIQFTNDAGYSARAFRLRRPLLIPDAVNDLEIAYQGEIEELAAIKSAIVVPLTVHGEVIGVLALDNLERYAAFDETDLSVLTGIAATAALIIERARLFDEVNRQALQMAQIMQTAPQGLLLVSSDGRVLMANRVGVRDLSVLAQAQVGDVLTRLGDQALSDLLIAPPTGPWVEVHAGERIFEVIARPVQGEGVSGQWVILVDDVTRVRQMREQAQLQERLATVGQLAAGIAHDFNNILTIILLHVQLAATSSTLTETDRERMGIIVQQTQYATDLVRQILDFSRQSILQRQVVDLVALLQEQSNWLERILPEDIEIDLTSSVGDLLVFADPTRIRQAVMNLAINARDVMSKGGALHIRLDRFVLRSDQDAPVVGMDAGGWATISVADTGPGIPAHVLPHIFDPFFTTKGSGRGTGLGLAQVHGIVTQHDGHVKVETKEGEGTTFVIYLPEMVVESGEHVAAQPKVMYKGDDELILLVEDNNTLREAMSDMLTSVGYRVLAAANGAAALGMIDAHGDETALVLSDVVMPGIGGVALVKMLRERGWQKPVVLMSGHPLDEERNMLQSIDVSAWLLKPCSLEDVTRVLNQLLSSTA
jgi:PAS domain S-box-containing protein